MIGFRNPLRAFVTFCLWLGMASAAVCQSYPSRPITMIVPLGPGGSTDIIARTIAEGMGEILGQPIIVENSTGNRDRIARMVLVSNRVWSAAPTR